LILCNFRVLRLLAFGFVSDFSNFFDYFFYGVQKLSFFILY
jgi:hypothetical protein